MRILKFKKILTMTFAMILLGISCMTSYGSEEGNWSLSEDGKYWMYFYSPDDPAKDEWIVEDGKEYYVDSQGRMKTGWVTDKSDGNRYYMGEDGAKCYNTFTPDGKYVGPDGIVLKEYDTYRKVIGRQLQKIMKDKAFKELKEEELPGFLLKDLNGDEYRDLVVMNRVSAPSRVLLAAVWDPKAEELVPAAEADLSGEERSRLTFNQETLSVWLEVTGAGGNQDCFQLKHGSAEFDQIWHFETGRDEWGDPLYYVNRQQTSLEEWEETRQLALEEMGSPLTDSLFILKEETVKEALEKMPEEELLLWQ